MKTKSADWLSPRECEVLQHLARGSSFKWAASMMGISTNSAQTLGKRAYAKLGVHDRYAAIKRHPKHRWTPSRACNVTTLSPTPAR